MSCMPPNVDQLISYTDSQATKQNIDLVSNLADDKVSILDLLIYHNGLKCL